MRADFALVGGKEDIMMKKRIVSVLLIMTMLIPLSAAFVSAEEEGPEPKTESLVLPEIIAEKGSPEANHIRRMSEMETEMNQIAFLNDDGTMTHYLFNEAVKYVGPDGNTYDKSNRLVKEADGSYRNVENDIGVTYSAYARDGVRLTAEGFEIEMKPAEMKDVDAAVIPIDRKSVGYRSVFATGDVLTYQQTFSGYKECLTLAAPPATDTFCFAVSISGGSLTEAGNTVELWREGVCVGRFSSLMIFDANGALIGVGAVRIMSDDGEGNYLLAEQLPEGLLESEEVEYPIIVDPSFTVVNTSTAKVVNDTTIVYEDSHCYGGEEFIFVGNNTTPIWFALEEITGKSRVLMSFPGLLNSPMYIYHDSQMYPMYATDYELDTRVTSVQLHFCDLLGTVEKLIEIYRFTGTWTEASTAYSSSIWNAKTQIQSQSSGGPYTPMLFVDDGGTPCEYASWNVFPFFEQLGNNITESSSIMMKANNESVNGYAILGSSDHTDPGKRPYVTVTMNAEVPLLEKGCYQIKSYGTAKAITCAADGMNLSTSNAESSAQQFLFQSDGNGKYRIVPVDDRTKCISSSGTLATISLTDPSQCWTLIRGNTSTLNTVRLFNSTSFKWLQQGANNLILVDDYVEASQWVCKFIRLDVPSFIQSSSDTCGPTSAAMLLGYYGLSISENEICSYINGNNQDYTYAYVLRDTLNYYSVNHNFGITFVTEAKNESLMSLSSVLSKLEHCILQGVPFMDNIKTNDVPSWPYSSGGHYVVITGLYTIDQQTYVVINDPHFYDGNPGICYYTLEKYYSVTSATEWKYYILESGGVSS